MRDNTHVTSVNKSFLPPAPLEFPNSNRITWSGKPIIDSVDRDHPVFQNGHVFNFGRV